MLYKYINHIEAKQLKLKSFNVYWGRFIIAYTKLDGLGDIYYISDDKANLTNAIFYGSQILGLQYLGELE